MISRKLRMGKLISTAVAGLLAGGYAYAEVAPTNNAEPLQVAEGEGHSCKGAEGDAHSCSGEHGCKGAEGAEGDAHSCKGAEGDAHSCKGEHTCKGKEEDKDAVGCNSPSGCGGK
jgi:hypothetical protein